MNILISGSTGLIGSALVSALKEKGHAITALVRTETKNGASGISWDPMEGEVDAGRLEGFDAVIHLAGENVAKGRWTESKKKKIRDSRIKSTQYLSAMLAGLSRPPKVFICASAIGYYGDRGDEDLFENSPPGKSFLAEVCSSWEKTTQMASDQGIRVVHLRIGVVLTPKGGALKRMLFPFQMGAGGKIGNGRQFMSWISIDDVVGVIQYVIENESLEGAVNCVTPQPVRNMEFTKTLGKVLFRPTLLPLPAWVAQAVFGQLARELLLASTKVNPKKLQDAGYAFQQPELEGALKYLLK